jgi:(1->4)-alpha-D-glucan 1-alpha-D-glucosylmutase
VTELPAPRGRSGHVRATYRVQLHAGFTFDDAAELAPYLADLGVSHLYCSPYLQAAPGSTHGYDVVDHTRLNDELGGAEGHARMTAALAEHGIGQVLDIVPNHMAVAGRANAWWWDVLENGPSSRYATYFDIDWDPPERKLIAQVLVPILGDHYGRVLENGELVLEREGGSFLVRYHEHELPVSPRALDDLLARAEERVSSDELASLANAFGRLPHALLTDRDSVLERHRDKEVLRQRLADLCAGDAAIALAIDEEVKAVNDDVELLHVLLERQNYRLAYWRTAGRELDYRRFFDITTLVALRTEEEHVFADVHELVLQLVADGAVDGLRIDHVDGLRDPLGYLQRLRAAAGPSTYLVVEKIVEGDEQLRPSWPVQGTSGYDFLVQVNTLLHDPAGEAPLTELYEGFTGAPGDVASLCRDAKHEIMRTVLATDVERLTAQFAVVAEGHRRYRDHTRAELRDALRETIASFDVYRTYVVGAEGEKAADEDVEVVSRAVARAIAARPDLDPELFGFLGDLLVLRYEGAAEVELAERFQQVSAPVMAKAVEDTVFYRYLRLVSLNEVGGDPAEFGGSVADFHERRIAGRANRSLLAPSTHDTKRSEDVRARLAVLTEIPDAWAAAVERWHALVEETGIDRPTEYLAYQTVVGAWPLTVDRLQAYLEKATKEAKLQTSWIDADPDYDAVVASFAASLLGNESFVPDLERFLADTGLVEAGQWNSLVQTALKLTCPGVPDLYQGSELWDLSLVDPDNRRPVDFAHRAVLCRNLPAVGANSDTERVGVEKLRLIRTLLHLRRDRPELFDVDAGYEPLAVEGPDAERVIAFSRAGGALQVVACRFPLRGPLDAATTYADVLAGRPVAVLVDGEAAL